MRFLLDENIPEELVLVFCGVRQEAEHIYGLGLAGEDDGVIAEHARDFDVFVTLDLHRQEREFLEVTRHLLDGGYKLLRVRLVRQPLGDAVTTSSSHVSFSTRCLSGLQDSSRTRL